MAARRLRHTSLVFALDEALSDREHMLYKAARNAAYGELSDFPEPSQPTTVEQHYLNAIEAFARRRPTHGYDEIDRGNHIALLRLGRSRKRTQRDPLYGSADKRRIRWPGDLDYLAPSVVDFEVLRNAKTRTDLRKAGLPPDVIKALSESLTDRQGKAPSAERISSHFRFLASRGVF